MRIAKEQPTYTFANAAGSAGSTVCCCTFTFFAAPFNFLPSAASSPDACSVCCGCGWGCCGCGCCLRLRASFSWVCAFNSSCTRAAMSRSAARATFWSRQASLPLLVTLPPRMRVLRVWLWLLPLHLTVAMQGRPQLSLPP